MKSQLDWKKEIFGDDYEEDEEDENIFNDAQIPSYDKKSFDKDNQQDISLLEKTSSFKRAPLKRSLHPSLTQGIYSGVVVSKKNLEFDEFEVPKKKDPDELLMRNLLSEMEKESKEEKLNVNDFDAEENVGDKIFGEMFKELESTQDDAVERLKRKRKKEVSKARGVLSQKILHNNLVNWRIEMQPIVRTVNGLKSGEADGFPEERDEVDEEIRKVIANMRKFRNNVKAREKIEDPEEEKTNEKVKVELDDLWENIDGEYSKNFENLISPLDHWDRTATMKRIGGDNYNQDVQNDRFEFDESSEMKKGKGKRKGPRYFQSINQTIGKRITTDISANLEKKIEKSVDNDLSLYDDSVFYRQLMKEHLRDVGTLNDTSGSDGLDHPSFGMEDDFQDSLRKGILQSAQNLRVEREDIEMEDYGNRKKKKATRTSKDRVLNYEVRPKLVGFMTPKIGDGNELPRNVDLLFNNIFGGNSLERHGRVV